VSKLRNAIQQRAAGLRGVLLIVAVAAALVVVGVMG
jgi:hypothetical protein